MKFQLKEIADFLGATLFGNGEIELKDITKINEAKEGDLTFLHNPKYFSQIETTKASAVIVPLDFEKKTDIPLLKTKDPYAAFVKMLNKFYPEQRVVKLGINKFSSLADSVKIGKKAAIAAMVVIEDNVQIGDNVQIAANVTISSNVKIGDNVIIHSGCSIREGSVLGNGVILQNGAVIGSDGFGFSPSSGSYDKIPQVGNVILEDNVEIGTNTVIDRATMGSTIIRKGTKLDNLIQIGHNVEIGQNTVIASQTGVSGSTTIGSNCMIGGQVGFVGHITIADGCMIGAKAGITGNLKTGSVVTGNPARDLKKMRKIDASLTRLPDLLYKVKEIDKKLKSID